jgi:hypothetical protein
MSPIAIEGEHPDHSASSHTELAEQSNGSNQCKTEALSDSDLTDGSKDLAAVDTIVGSPDTTTNNGVSEFTETIRPSESDFWQTLAGVVGNVLEVRITIHHYF